MPKPTVPSRIVVDAHKVAGDLLQPPEPHALEAAVAFLLIGNEVNKAAADLLGDGINKG